MAGFWGINLLTANSGGTLAEMLALNAHTNFKKKKKNVRGEAQWHWDSDIYCKGGGATFCRDLILYLL